MCSYFRFLSFSLSLSLVKQNQSTRPRKSQSLILSRSLRHIRPIHDPFNIFPISYSHIGTISRSRTVFIEITLVSASPCPAYTLDENGSPNP